MKSKSILMPVYNEDMFLNYSLKNIIPYVDEIVIIDSSPYGPSTDNTENIVSNYSSLYPNKIKYTRRTFVNDNGSWDESSARNLALELCSGDIIIPHCGDMIYFEEDFIKICEVIDNIDVDIYIFPLVEFWLNRYNIRLYRGHALEDWFPVIAVGDIPALRRELISEYNNGPHLELKRTENIKFMYITDVYRYHFGWISGFEKQVLKHFRNIRMRQWLDNNLESMSDGELVNWSIHHVLDYPKYGFSCPYTGKYPLPFETSYLDGYDAVISNYKEKYGDVIDV